MKSFACSLSKRGNEPDECEDDYAIDLARGRFAIADGASESSFAKEWARLLVEHNAVTPVRWERRWRDWLPPLQQLWLQQVKSRPLPWYAEWKAEQGAFSTFLSLLVDTTRTEQRWWSSAVGDSCLFHVRDDQLLTSFPIERSEEFGSNPNLIGSRAPVLALPPGHEHWRIGKCQSRDRFFLATDALSEWILRQCESQSRPWQTLFAQLAESTDSFSAWIEDLRDRRQIRNDDITLVIIEI